MDASPGVWLVRHGHTQLNSTDPSRDLIRGWKDVPLDAEGQKEAKETIAFISAKIQPQIIFSSDLQRCTIIAKAAAEASHIPLKITQNLRPWGLGQFQGQPAEKVVPQLQYYIDHPNEPVPGGESFGAFRNRVLQITKQVLDLFLKTNQNIVLVTHFRDLKLIQAWLAHPKGGATEDLDAGVFAANDIPTAGMLRIYRERGRWKTKVEINPRIGVKRTDTKAAS